MQASPDVSVLVFHFISCNICYDVEDGGIPMHVLLCPYDLNIGCVKFQVGQVDIN